MSMEHMVALAKELFAAKARKADIEDQLKAVNEQITLLSTEKLGKAMEDGEVDKFTIDGLGTVYLGTELYVSVLKENRPALHAWLRDNKSGDMIQESVPPQTLKAFAKERLAEGLPLPEVMKATPIVTAKTRSK